MSPILVTGAGGRLGSALTSFLAARGKEVVGLTRPDCDLGHKAEVLEVISSLKPELILHPAAMTNVDACELDPEKARRDNVDAVVNLAHASRINGSRLVNFSTDYVFDGQKSSPYTENDRPHPINVYGTTKFAAEEAVIRALENYVIIRVSWLFGVGGDFVSFVVESARSGYPLKLGTDHRGSPGYIPDLLEPVMDIASSRETGIFHLANRGDCTRLEMGEEILRVTELKADPIPSNAQEIGFVARRPPYTPISSEKYERLFYRTLRPWQEALRDYLKDAG